MRLREGVMGARVMSLEALERGLDVDALDLATQQGFMKQLKANPSGKTSAILNNPPTIALAQRSTVW